MRCATMRHFIISVASSAQREHEEAHAGPRRCTVQRGLVWDTYSACYRMSAMADSVT